MIALARMPIFGFAVLAFLFLCTILAFAVWFATRGTGDPSRTRISGPAGCGIGCALLAIAGLGAIATVFVIVVNLPAEWARHGPISRIGLHYEDAQGEEIAPKRTARDGGTAADTRLRAEIELRPGFEAGPILRVLRREVSAGLDLTVRQVDRDGESHTVIEVDVPLDAEARGELRRTLRDIEEDVPELDLPSGIVFEIRGPND